MHLVQCLCRVPVHRLRRHGGVGGRRSQQPVHDGTLLGGIYLFTGKHGIPMLLKAGLAGQIQQQFLRLGVDQVLGQISKDMRRVLAERLETIRVGGESIAQIKGVARGLENSLKRGPGGGAIATGTCHG